MGNQIRTSRSKLRNPIHTWVNQF